MKPEWWGASLVPEEK